MPINPIHAAQRMAGIEPFYVMELVKAADALAAAGRDIIHMSIGEPDFTAPEPVVEAMVAAVRAGRTGYTQATGIQPLREAIARHYQMFHGLSIDPARVVVTAGASAALLLACGSVLDPGQEVLMPDPSYPCNRHIVSAFNGVARLIPAGPEQRFQLSAADVARHWGPRTRAVLLASPSNPTGTTITPQALAAVWAEVRQRSGVLLMDEIYSGLSYGHAPQTALSQGDDLIVINSFSKYFNMTGWRLGWLVLPPNLVGAVEKLAQNLMICPSAPAQHAALACFSETSLAIYEARRTEFARRREYLLPALERLGFSVPVVPDGAFYIYADVSVFGLDSNDLAQRLLHEAGVCVVPGNDFGVADPGRWLRISYATGLPRIEEAIGRMAQVLGRL